MTVFIEFIARIAFWIYLACGVVMLFYLRAILLAWRERGTALHTAEKEAATSRAYHSVLAIGGLLLVGVVAFVDSTLAPALAGLPREELPESMLVTPSPALSPLPVTPTPTLERPTRPAVVIPTTLPSPSPTQPPPASACPNPKARITSPAMGAKVEGRVEIWGTADIDQFQYYKVEYGVGETPPGWVVIDELKYEPVSEGVLVVWNTAGLTPGTYTLRLTVVDITGNYPEPRCRVSVILE
ncbi:MAG: hypothetical protein ACE5LG_09685 [Anaerolineae bacterium]